MAMKSGIILSLSLTIFCVSLALSALLAMGGCGAAGLPSGGPGLSAEQQASGVRLAGYEVIRLNADGTRDPALNPTLSLRLAGENELVIAVRDAGTAAIALEVRFDGRRIHAERAEYHGLLGGAAEVLSASFLSPAPGVAALGQACLRDHRPGPVDGDFVTLRFA